MMNCPPEYLSVADQISHVCLEYDVTDLIRPSTIQNIGILMRYRLVVEGIPEPEVDIKFFEVLGKIKCYLYIVYKAPVIYQDKIWHKVYGLITSKKLADVSYKFFKSNMKSFLASSANNLVIRSITSETNSITKLYDFTQGHLAVQYYNNFSEDCLPEFIDDGLKLIDRFGFDPTRKLIISSGPSSVAAGLDPWPSQGCGVVSNFTFQKNDVEPIQFVSSKERATLIFAITSDQLGARLASGICRYINADLFSSCRDQYKLYLLIAFYDEISSKLIVVAQAPGVNSEEFNSTLMAEIVEKVNIYLRKTSVSKNLEIISRMPVNSIAVKRLNEFVNGRSVVRNEQEVDQAQSHISECEIYNVGVVANNILPNYTRSIMI